MRKALTLFAMALLPALATAQSVGETRLRADTTNMFTRLERAWAAYQLKATTAQYDVGDIVTPAAAPATMADLFNPYRLQPAARDDRSFNVVQVNGVNATVCVSSYLRSADELSGFMLGMRQSNAQVAASDCTAGTLNAAVSFPAQVFARKPIVAKRAAELIAKDAAERAAQAAVADTITFGLPAGKLLDFIATQGQTSDEKAVALTNSSGELWSASVVVLDGPFTARLVGCEVVGPTGTCGLYVAFSPTAVGKATGHVKVTTSTGKDLILRLAGVASPA